MQVNHSFYASGGAPVSHTAGCSNARRPLYNAVQRGDCDELVNLLRDDRNDPNEKSSLGVPLLIFAVQRAIRDKSTELVRTLLSDPRTDPNVGGIHGESPLYIAAAHGRNDLIEMFLEHPNVDPNASHGVAQSLTPLSATLFNRNFESTKLLLRDKRVDVNRCRALHHGILKGYTEILDSLMEHEDANLLLSQSESDTTPFLSAATSKLQTVRKVDQKAFPIDSKRTSNHAEWTRVSFLPVSCDSLHKPTLDFLDNIQVINCNLLRSSGRGELELIQEDEEKDHLTRVIFKTDQFMTLTLLRSSKPVGPTLYRPLAPIEYEKFTPSNVIDYKKLITLSQNIWHIANDGISTDRRDVLAMIDLLVQNKLIVLRALHQESDPKRILEGKPLKGRGYSKNIRDQVKGDAPTALLSVSVEPVSTFVRGRSEGSKNGGYAAIFTKKGAKVFLGFKGDYPSYHTHERVMKEVQGDHTLTERAYLAKEAMFDEPVPLDLVALFDKGYPTVSGIKVKKSSKKFSIPRKIQKLLYKHKVDFEILSDSDKEMLCSNKGLKSKSKILEKYTQTT